MTASCSDFTDNILNTLIVLNLISNDQFAPDDPGAQSDVAVAAINRLAKKVTSLNGLFTMASAPGGIGQHEFSRPGGWRDQVSAILNADAPGPGCVFMSELLERFDALSCIADEYGSRTLVDVTYLLSAVNKGTFVEHEAGESRLAEAIEELPSARRWKQYIKMVTF